MKKPYIQPCTKTTVIGIAGKVMDNLVFSSVGSQTESGTWVDTNEESDLGDDMDW